MKTMARILIIALGLGLAGSASAHGQHRDYDAFYAVGGQTRSDTTDRAWMSWLPHDPESRDTLSGGPVGGLPDRN